MTTLLTLHLAGPFEARGPDGRPIRDLSRRGQAILAYLADQPSRSASRTALATLIWGDRGEEQARASLRQELSRLRRNLPEGVLHASRTDVMLDEAGVTLKEPHGAAFLADFDLSAAGFDDWLREARQRSAERRCRAGIEAGLEALREADAEQAAECARTVLRIDPMSEPAMQLLLRAAAHLEDRAGTLAEFARFGETLDRELGVAPSPATVELAEALKGPIPLAADHTRQTERDGNAQPVLAVLPFEELGAASDDMFADGIVDEITATLGRAHDCQIIARQSAYALQGVRLDHAEAGARLGADYLVEGTVRRSGDRVRIAAQLVESATGRVCWSDRVDDRIDDLFDLQDRIAEQVSGAVWPSLRAAEIQRAQSRRRTERSVYELVLTAYPHLWAHRRDRCGQAIALLDAALEKDPAYPVALALKAYCHAGSCSYFWTRDPDEDKAIARALVARAISETLDHAPTLVACAAATTMVSDDVELARDLTDRALWLDSNNAWGWSQAGWIACFRDDPASAMEHFDRSERLSPLDPFRFTTLFGKAVAMVKLGRLDDAAVLVEDGIRINSGASWAYRMLAAIHALAGNNAKAREAARKLGEAHPHLTAEYVAACLPPGWSRTNPYWLESMISVGIGDG